MEFVDAADDAATSGVVFTAFADTCGEIWLGLGCIVCAM